jgi:hypothetical protein
MDMQVEMKKIIIDRMLFVLSCGSVLDVARYFEAASGSIDGTLLRYYVTEVRAHWPRYRKDGSPELSCPCLPQVCAMVAPPFSRELSQSLLCVVRDTADSLEQTPDAAQAVIAFLGACTTLHPPHPGGVFLKRMDCLRAIQKSKRWILFAAECRADDLDDGHRAMLAALRRKLGVESTTSHAS